MSAERGDWDKQGAFFLAAALSCGVLAARASSAGAGWCLVILAAAAAAAAGLLWAGAKRLSTLALLAAVAALGAYDASLSLSKPADSISLLLAQNSALSEGAVIPFKATVFDRVRGASRAGRTTWRYAIRVETAPAGRGSGGARGKALLDCPDDLPYGSVIEGKALFRLPPGATCPGQFDYRRYLAAGGIECLARAGAGGVVRVVSLPKRYSPGRAICAARRRLLEKLATLGLDREGVIPAVLLGDRTALSDSARDAFVRSGTMHLLAISGMNLAMVAGLLICLLRLFRTPPKAASVITLAVSAVYVAIVGPIASVVRAGLMLGLFCLGVVADRETRALAVVSTAALVMLLVEPLQLFDAGFQLSFVSVLGLFYIGLPLGNYLAKAARPLGGVFAELVGAAAQVFAVSLGAGGAVTPLVAYHFGVVSLISPFANIILIPVTWVMTVAGFAAMLASFASAKLGSLVAMSASGAETALVILAGLFAKAPLAYAYVSAPPAWAIAAAYVMLVALALAVAAGRRVASVVVAGLAAANLAAGLQLLAPSKRPPEIVTLSGGRAAAVVAFDDRGRAALFLGRKADVRAATDVICPFLLQRRVTRVEIIVESAGADARIRDALRDRIGVGKVVRQARFKGAPPWAGLVPAARGVEEVGPGDRVEGAGGFVIAFHSGKPKEIPAAQPAAPVERAQPYFEGLVADVRVDGKRALVVIDATDGCLAVARGKLSGSAEAICLLNYAGAKDTLELLRAALGRPLTVAAGPGGDCNSIVLADPVSLRRLSN